MTTNGNGNGNGKAVVHFVKTVTTIVGAVVVIGGLAFGSVAWFIGVQTKDLSATQHEKMDKAREAFKQKVTDDYETKQHAQEIHTAITEKIDDAKEQRQEISKKLDKIIWLVGRKGNDDD